MKRKTEHAPLSFEALAGEVARDLMNSGEEAANRTAQAFQRNLNIDAVKLLHAARDMVRR